MDERTLRWASSCSVMSPARSRLLLVFGRLNIAIWRRDSSMDCLCLTAVGRTITSSYVAITGRGFHGRNLMGTLSKSVGLRGLPRHLVCVFPLICLFLFVVSHDLLCFLLSCSIGSSTTELRVKGENFKNFGY